MKLDGAHDVGAKRPFADPVTHVLTEMKRSRSARLIRRFRHGAGGTSLIELGGREVVLKAWPTGSPIAANLPVAFGHMRTLRSQGVVVPGVVEHGELAGQRYVLYERLPGRWPARVTGRLLGEMIAVVDAERGAAPGDGAEWPQRVRVMLFDGDPMWDITPSVLEGRAAGRILLGRARAFLEECDSTLLAGGDIVHGDFAPENVLACRGHLSGVVDWEQCRAGDARFDLIGLLFDLELGEKAAPAVSAQLRHALRERLPAAVLALYTAIYAVRYTSWAIGTEMEAEVFGLVERLARHDG